MFHWYVSTLLWCDFTVCFTDLSIHLWVWSHCEIHWYVSTLGGCDHTVGFTDTSLPFWDVILLCDSLVHFYNTTQHWILEDSSLHSCQRGNLRSHSPWRNVYLWFWRREIVFALSLSLPCNSWVGVMMALYRGVFILLIPLCITSILTIFSWPQLFNLFIQLIQLSNVLIYEGCFFFFNLRSCF